MTRPAEVPSLHAETADRNTNGGFSPIKVMEVELTEPLPGVTGVNGSEQDGQVWILARIHTESIGVCTAPLSEEGFSSDQLAELLWRQLNEPIVERLTAAGIMKPVALTDAGLRIEQDA